MASNNPMVPTPTTPGGLTHDESMYRGVALSQLNILRQQMQLGGLNSGRRSVKLDNGVEIHCNICFNKEDVFVRVPASGNVSTEANEEVFIRIALLHQGYIGNETIYDSLYDKVPATADFRRVTVTLGLGVLWYVAYDVRYSFAKINQSATLSQKSVIRQIYTAEPFPSLPYVTASTTLESPEAQLWMRGGMGSLYVGVFKKSRYIHCLYTRTYTEPTAILSNQYTLQSIGTGTLEYVAIINNGKAYKKWFGYGGGLSRYIDSACVASFTIGDTTKTFLLGTSSLSVANPYTAPPILNKIGTIPATLFMYEEGINNPDKIGNTLVMESTNGVYLPPATYVVFDSTGKKGYGFCVEREARESEAIDQAYTQTYNMPYPVLEQQQYTFVVDITCHEEYGVFKLKYTVTKTKFNHSEIFEQIPQDPFGDNQAWSLGYGGGSDGLLYAAAYTNKASNFSYKKIHAVDVIDDIPVLCVDELTETYTSSLGSYNHTYEWTDTNGDQQSTTITYFIPITANRTVTVVRSCGEKTLEIFNRASSAERPTPVDSPDQDDSDYYTWHASIESLEIHATRQVTPQFEDMRSDDIWYMLHYVNTTYTITTSGYSGSISVPYSVGSIIYVCELARGVKLTQNSTPKEKVDTFSYGWIYTASTPYNEVFTSWGSSSSASVFAGEAFELGPADWIASGSPINYLVSASLGPAHTALKDIKYGGYINSSYVVVPMKENKFFTFASKGFVDGTGMTYVSDVKGGPIYEQDRFYRWYFPEIESAAYLKQN